MPGLKVNMSDVWTAPTRIRLVKLIDRGSVATKNLEGLIGKIGQVEFAWGSKQLLCHFRSARGVLINPGEYKEIH